MYLALLIVLLAGCTRPAAAPSRPATPSVSATASVVPTPTLTTTLTPTSSPNASGTARPSATVIVNADLASSTAARAAGDPAAARKAADCVRALAVDLYRELAAPGKNMVFSPYSAAAALALTRVGARGATAQQMDTVLHTQLVIDLDAAFNALDLELAKRAAPSPYGHLPLQLATANRLWAQRGLTFATPFLDRIAAYYGASVGLVDYVNARETARKAINAWVSDATQARIPDLVKQEQLNELTRFVLTNALYFKAQWFVPFSKQATRSGPFHKLDGTAVEAQLMTRLASMPYAKGPGYQAASLAYANELSMVFIVPDTGALSSFERGLDAQVLSSILTSLAYESVELSLPKFQFRTRAPLRMPLERLGMPMAFTDKADFSGITTQAHLLLQDAVQEAFIAADEEGTEAAAATAVIGGATGGPSQWVTLTIDRPFIFLIRDDATGTILFMGRVLDPTVG